MKDIDDLLAKEIVKPTRELSQTFTERIIMMLKTNPKPRKTTLWLRLRSHKLGALSASGLLLIGGTAAAIALWPTPSVTKTVTKLLPSGNHIVGYNAQNCNYFGTLDGTPPKQQSENEYYEVRQGSTLTDAQLQSSLQGVCEENMSNNTISSIMHQLPRDRQGDSSQAYAVVGITAHSITVSLDPHYDQTLSLVQPNQTYTRFDPNMVVFAESTKSSFSDIHIGDTVKFITKDTSGRSTEDPTHYVPANHPENQVIEAILKIPALTADPDTLMVAIAKDIVRVEPCTNSATGFCRVYDFAP